MTQDFAKIRPEPLLEKRPRAWSSFLTGVVLGFALGVGLCLTLYGSGRVPLIQTPAPSVADRNPATADADGGAQASTQDREDSADREPATGTERQPLELEFYTELQNYEVAVDATPVDLSPPPPEPVPGRHYMLQTGAFKRRELAEREVSRQQMLGLAAAVRERSAAGDTLYLVQSGPYASRRELDQAEQILLANSIPSLRRQVP